MVTAFRFLSYAATLVTAGGMLYVAVIADRRPAERPRLGRAVTVSAAVAIVATLAELGLHAADLTGRGLSGVADPEVLAAVLESTFGTSVVMRVLALAVVAVSVAFAWRPWAVGLGLGAAVAASGSFLLTGHTVEAQPPWLAVTSALVHTVAAAAWFGGLVFLRSTLRARAGDGDPAGRAALVVRFSTVATIAVLAVSIAGALRVPTIMRVDASVLDSAYAVALGVKVLLVGVIFVIAGYNHWRLVPAIRAARGDAEHRLRATVRVEASALMVVIALSSLLADLSPPDPRSTTAFDTPRTAGLLQEPAGGARHPDAPVVDMPKWPPDRRLTRPDRLRIAASARTGDRPERDGYVRHEEQVAPVITGPMSSERLRSIVARK